jgi:hypothetical protein
MTTVRIRTPPPCRCPVPEFVLWALANLAVGWLLWTLRPGRVSNLIAGGVGATSALVDGGGLIFDTHFVTV